jgi:hypothetical protein
MTILFQKRASKLIIDEEEETRLSKGKEAYFWTVKVRSLKLLMLEF